MTLARELFEAYASGDHVAVAPTARAGGCNLATAYAVGAELTRMRRADGHATVGRKVAFANKAAWRLLELQTVAWAHMYDDTVQFSKDGHFSPSLARARAPRLEPEVVMKLKTGRGGGPSNQHWLVGSHGDPTLPTSSDAAAVLESVEWLALGFELVDNPFPDWKFQPADLVASFGFHAGLIVGTPRVVDRDSIPSLVDELAAFTVRLSKNGELIEAGGGKNVLKSPALCLGELASAIAAQQPGAEPLRPGELVSTGSLTAVPFIGAGERWDVVASGLDVPPLAIDLCS
jgi:2-oxo-3-hexenedioate decarboxylase